MDNKNKNKNLLSKISIKHIHIALIVLGAIFAILPCFHTNIWFDESYSLSISKHSFGEYGQLEHMMYIQYYTIGCLK